MATNLWTDTEALLRLADTARSTEPGAEAPLAPDDGLAGLPSALGVWSHALELDATEMPAHVVSGDFWDAFPLSDDTLAVAIADISGKGVPAGVMRAFTRSMVRNVSLFSDAPEDVLDRVNRMLLDVRLEAMYVTLFLGWLHLPSGLLRYANAGHPRPLRIGARSRPSPLGDVTGPILGILDGLAFGGGEIQLACGETLLLYTDGVTEARGAGGRFLGTQGLSTLLGRHARGTVMELGAAVAAAVDRHQAGRRHDDATIVTLRWNGGAAF
jgi:phosphoserine phosphatase RsbU/P